MQITHTQKSPVFYAGKYRVGIVVSEFNLDISQQLLTSTLSELERFQVLKNNIKICRAAGCVEIPVLLKALAQTKKYDCLIALGCVIRGATTHYDYVCKIVSEGLLRITLDFTIPIGFGVLTVENKKQALERIALGAGAVAAALGAAKEIKALKK